MLFSLLHVLCGMHFYLSTVKPHFHNFLSSFDWLTKDNAHPLHFQNSKENILYIN